MRIPLGGGEVRVAEQFLYRAQVRAAFADDDPSWLAALIERFDQVSASALAALAA